MLQKYGHSMTDEEAILLLKKIALHHVKNQLDKIKIKSIPTSDFTWYLYQVEEIKDYRDYDRGVYALGIPKKEGVVTRRYFYQHATLEYLNNEDDLENNLIKSASFKTTNFAKQVLQQSEIEHLRNEDFKVIEEIDEDTNYIYIKQYLLGNRNLLPLTCEFKTIEDYLDHIIVSIGALEDKLYDVEDEEEKIQIQQAIYRLNCEYVEAHSKNKFFMLEKDEYRDTLKHALLLALKNYHSMLETEGYYNILQNEDISVDYRIKLLKKALKSFDDFGRIDKGIYEFSALLIRQFG